MKKLIAITVLLILAVTLCACGFGKDDISVYSEDSVADVELDRFYSSDDETAVSSVETQWEYSGYFANLPIPDFIKTDPTKTQLAGGTLLTFKAENGTTLDELKTYLGYLENLGYVVVSDDDTDDVYTGTVYNDSVPVLEYTYRYGLILLDLYE